MLQNRLKIFLVVSFLAVGIYLGGFNGNINNGEFYQANKTEDQQLTSNTSVKGENNLRPKNELKEANFISGLENLPRSLQGVEVDGVLECDESGHLKLNYNVRRLFDYFLNAIGEEPEAIILARIKAYILHNLPSEAAKEALAVLDNYLAYRNAAAFALAENKSSAETKTEAIDAFDATALHNKKMAIQLLRKNTLTAEIDQAFFAEEDAYDEFTLSRLAIVQNKELDESDKLTQLAALEANLTPAMHEDLRNVSRYQALQQSTADWQGRAGSRAELQQIRQQIVGSEAAERLAALDVQREQWEQRLNDWWRERDAIRQNNALSDLDKNNQLLATRKTLFSAPELNRIESLERIHDAAEGK